MVDERQAERQVRRAPFGERRALLAAPAEAGRRVGHVADERQDGRRAFGAERQVEGLDDGCVRIQGDRVLGVRGRDSRVVPVVAANVPEDAAAARSRCLPDEGLLVGRICVIVRIRLAISGPSRPAGCPFEPLDELPQLAGVGPDQLGVESRLLQVALDLAVRVTVLEPRVQDDVREDAAAEAVAEAEERPHLGRLDPLERAAEPRLEGHALVGLEQKWVEDERAELAVARPRLAFTQPLEGADIDEDRLRASPLHVVRGGILEHEPLVEGFEEQVELEERGVLEHPERPLVRIGDHRDPLVPEHGRDAALVELAGQAVGLGDALGGDQAPIRDAVSKEIRYGERVPVGEPAL